MVQKITGMALLIRLNKKDRTREVEDKIRVKFKELSGRKNCHRLYVSPYDKYVIIDIDNNIRTNSDRPYGTYSLIPLDMFLNAESVEDLDAKVLAHTGKVGFRIPGLTYYAVFNPRKLQLKVGCQTIKLEGLQQFKAALDKYLP